jgi:hypothetical protein
LDKKILLGHHQGDHRLGKAWEFTLNFFRWLKSKTNSKFPSISLLINSESISHTWGIRVNFCCI